MRRRMSAPPGKAIDEDPGPPTVNPILVLVDPAPAAAAAVPVTVPDDDHDCAACCLLCCCCFLVLLTVVPILTAAILGAKG